MRDLSWGADCEECGTRMNAGQAEIAAERSPIDRLLCGACRDVEKLTNERDRYRYALDEVSSLTVRKGGDFAVIWNIARRALEEGVLDRV